MRSNRTDIGAIFLSLLSFDSAVMSGFVDLDEGLDLDFYPGSDFDLDLDLDLRPGLEIVDLEKNASSTPMRATTNFAAAHGSAKKMPTELVKTLSQNASIVGRNIGEHRVFTPTILVIL